MNRKNKTGELIPKDLPKWRGSFEDFQNPDSKLCMFDIPWAFVRTKGNMAPERKDELSDMLAWAMASDLVEGFPEIDDQLLGRVFKMLFEPI